LHHHGLFLIGKPYFPQVAGSISEQFFRRLFKPERLIPA
jgi:hypothetical protein